MYKRKKLVNRGRSTSDSYAPCADSVRIARPLSYYVNGGVDLDGVSTRRPVEGHYDSAESLASDEVDLTSDPTVTRLDIAEYASMKFADSTTKRSAEKFTDTPDDNSD